MVLEDVLESFHHAITLGSLQTTDERSVRKLALVFKELNLVVKRFFNGVWHNRIVQL